MTESGSPSVWRLIWGGVNDYWPYGLGDASTVGIGGFGLWAGLQPHRALPWICFAASGVVFVISGIARWRRAPRLSRLERENEELAGELETERLSQQGDYYDLMRRQLSTLATAIGFGTTERISVFKYDAGAGQFVRLGRYSKNPVYDNAPGRGLYPADQGCIASAWQHGEAFAVLPDPDDDYEAYASELERRWNYTREVIDGLTMRSRFYAGFALLDSKEDHNIAVVIFESTVQELDHGQLRDTMKTEAKRISQMLEVMKSLEPTPSFAREEGF